MSFDWGKHAGGSGYAFVAFEQAGDNAAGEVVALREHTFKGQDKPTVLVDVFPNGAEEPVTITCKVDLLHQFRDLDVQVGDRIRVTFTGTEPTESGGRKKLFKVEHRKGERKPELVPEPPPEDDVF